MGNKQIGLTVQRWVVGTILPSVDRYNVWLHSARKTPLINMSCSIGRRRRKERERERDKQIEVVRITCPLVPTEDCMVK